MKAKTVGEDLLVCGNLFQRAGPKTLNDRKPCNAISQKLLKEGPRFFCSLHSITHLCEISGDFENVFFFPADLKKKKRQGV